MGESAAEGKGAVPEGSLRHQDIHIGLLELPAGTEVPAMPQSVCWAVVGSESRRWEGRRKPEIGEVTLSRQESEMGPLGAGDIRGVDVSLQGQPLVQPRGSGEGTDSPSACPGGCSPWHGGHYAPLPHPVAGVRASPVSRLYTRNLELGGVRVWEKQQARGPRPRKSGVRPALPAVTSCSTPTPADQQADPAACMGNHELYMAEAQPPLRCSADEGPGPGEKHQKQLER